MPPKRRLRNGTPTTSGKPLAAFAAAAQRQLQLQQQQQQLQQQAVTAAAAAAAAATDSATAAASGCADFSGAHGDSADHHHHHHHPHNNHPQQQQPLLAAGVPLTAKQQQQLERNQFLAALTKDQLRLECRKRGQKTTGNKTELLQRLGFKMTIAQNVAASATANSNSSVTAKSAAKQQNGSAGGGGGGDQAAQASSGCTSQSKLAKAADRERERADREQLVLWRQPLRTAQFCGREVALLLQTYWQKLNEHQYWIFAALLLIGAISAAHSVDGQHTPLLEAFRRNIGFVLYWVGLGVVSSVGLGTGLHTFLLYLGPHIASVTLAAYECNSLDFPQPPYPDEIICPETGRGDIIPTLWAIMSKVRLEAFLWGAGTALGELPPYFMAKAARLSGYDPEDDDDLKEFEELKKKREQGEHLSLLDRAKVSMEKIVERIGFLGILACASVPNPLFDLAGITCGHFLVPFWTFFGATLIGKAIIKMHIQKVFVIIAFNETLIERAMNLLGAIPVLGAKAQEPFKSFLKNQKARLHRGARDAPRIEESGNLLAKAFEVFVGAMVVYFVVSIVNSLAQSWHKRIHKKDGAEAAAAAQKSGGGRKAAKNK